MITFGISTRGRAKDLEITLANLVAAGYSNHPIIVVDDGSPDPISADCLRKFPNGIFIRHDESAGYVKRRHEIALMAQTPYYFSLDDDSFIASGDLGKLERYMSGLNDWIAIGFPIALPDGGRQVSSMHDQPYLCRSFVGCAHVLNLSVYRAIGGYGNHIVHQGEEIDIAARAFKMGYDTWHYPHLLVCHNVTSISRNYSRMAYHGARNKILFLRSHYTRSRKLIRIVRAILERVAYFARDGRIGHLSGVVSAVVAKIDDPARAAVNKRTMGDWERLPLY